MHPVQVESFARAGNLTVTLGIFFGLSAFLIDFRAVMRRSLWLAFAATGLFILGLLTRPSLVVWPLIAALVSAAAFPGRLRFIGAWCIPRLVIALGYVGLTMFLQDQVPESQHLHVAWWQRPLIAADSLFSGNGAQVLLPLRLTIDHGRNTRPETPNSKAYWMGFLAMAAVAFVLWQLLRSKQRLAALGICIFVLAVLPMTGLLPAHAREHFSVVYDRHLYLAMFGVALVATAGLEAASGRMAIASCHGDPHLGRLAEHHECRPLAELDSALRPCRKDQSKELVWAWDARNRHSHRQAGQPSLGPAFRSNPSD